MRKKFWLLAASLFLMACGNQENQEEGASSAGSPNTEASQLVLRVQSKDELRSTDTAQASSNIATFTTNMNIYNGLMTYDLDNQLVPADAAEMPEVSEDGLTYTFQIREDANWSNGDPVRAQDYVYGWQRMVDPETAAPYSYMYDGIVANAAEILSGERDKSELGVEALDNKTFQVTLQQPTSYFLDLITIPAFYPQHQETVENHDQYGTTSEDLVYNGPFTLKGWTAASGSEWQYAKNPEYWDAENVQVGEVHFQYLPETTTALNLYENGQLDVIELSGEFSRQYVSHSDYQVYPIPRTNYIEMNFDTFGLDNLHIRRALSQAINREDFVENVLGNGSVALNGQVSYEVARNPETGADFRADSTIETQYNLEAAQQDWQAGLQELGVDELSFELLVSEDEDSQLLAEYVQENVTNNLPGLNITIRTVPTTTLFSVLGQGDFDLGITFWQADFGDPINYLERFDSENTRGNYQIDEIDQLIDRSREQSNDPMARWQTLIEIEKMALDTYTLQAPVYQTFQPILEKPTVEDINRPGQSFTNYRWAKISE